MFETNDYVWFDWNEQMNKPNAQILIPCVNYKFTCSNFNSLCIISFIHVCTHGQKVPLILSEVAFMDHSTQALGNMEIANGST